MEKMCIKAVVSGRVQGVFFRDTTIKKAKSLQLTGWVRNTEDGNVELVACGAADDVKALAEWLWEGSPASKVTHVNWEEIPWQDFNDFTVRR